MKYKKILFAIGIVLLAFNDFDAKAMGPLPLPYPQQFYETNPSYRMTPEIRMRVQTAFNWMNQTFRSNHSACQGREQCLQADLQSLRNYIQSYPTDPANRYFQKIYNIILSDSQSQKFVSQWYIYWNLSQVRKREYQSGLRVTPIRPQNVKTPWGMTWMTVPAFYNQDDVFTDLLQQISHFHKNCDQYVTCLRGDLQIISNMNNRLAANDPARNALARLSQIITDASARRTFNTNLYLSLYNPLDPSWNDAFKKRKAKKLAGYGYTQWKSVQRNSSRPIYWKNPKVTNGRPMTYANTYPTSIPVSNKRGFNGWWSSQRNYIRNIFGG